MYLFDDLLKCMQIFDRYLDNKQTIMQCYAIRRTEERVLMASDITLLCLTECFLLYAFENHCMLLF